MRPTRIRVFIMRKKLFTLFLAIACVGNIFAWDYERVLIGDLYYNLDAINKTAEVTYQLQLDADNYKGLTDANIPPSVTYNSVTYSVTSIGGDAFYDCTGLTSVIIPNSVTSIGNFAFYGCTSLTSVTIPNNVRSIGVLAFYGCSGLTSITIPNSVTSIEVGAFSGCSGLTSPVYNAHLFAKMPTSYSGAYTIPDGIESIAGGAFYNCTGLTSITIGNSVTSIGEGAFQDCVGLKSINIPSNVTRIDPYAFEGCSHLTSIVVLKGNSVYDSRNNCNAIIKTASNTLMIGCNSTIIPNSVTCIGDGAFARCENLTSITIPNSVDSIGLRVFSRCSGLTSITCEAVTPPTCRGRVSDDLDKTIPLYVPVGSIDAYKAAEQWKDFGENIKPIQATPIDVTTIVAIPTDNSVEIKWPAITNATTYTIKIWKGSELICTIIFNEQGQLTIVFNAPTRTNETEQTQIAGFAFTVKGLESGTMYSYTVTAEDSSGNVINEEKGDFTTKMFDDVSIVQSEKMPSVKYIRNGQLFIQRGDEVFNAQGARVR